MNNTDLPAQRVWPAWLVLGIGVLATLLASTWVWHDTKLEQEAQFSSICKQVTLKIEERLVTYKLVLRGAAGLINASGKVERAEWRRYVETLKPAQNMANVQGIGFALRIPADQLARHTAQIRAEGFPGYAVHPAGPRDVYTSIIYLEPFSGRNLKAFGYDMYSEPVRRAAMEHAMDSGQAQLSGRVSLVQEGVEGGEEGEDVQPGVLMYVPVYRGDMPTGTVAQRRAALIGWTYSPYRMHDLMQGILQEWQDSFGHEFDLHIHDGNAATPGTLLFDSFGDRHAGETPTFTQTETLDFNGRSWLLQFQRSAPGGSLAYAAFWLTMGSGFAISGLLFWLSLTLLNTRLLAQGMAAELMQEADQHARLVRESEQRWLAALEGSNLGVWDWDVEAGTVLFSRLWKEMLGYADAEIGNSLDEWKTRVHPDDLASTLKKVQACFDGQVPIYDSEHRVLCKDGSYKWIRDRGSVVARDAAGKPLRMIGTHSDISERMQAEFRIRHLARIHSALSETNAVILRCVTEDELFENICRIVVEFGGVKMAWIGLVDAASGMIRPVSTFGTGTAYLEGIEVSVRADDPRGQGPTGTATRENRPMWFPDFMHDPLTKPWRARAAPYGWASSAALPICRHGKPVGALTFYSGELGWLDEEIRRLLEQMARQINFALDKLAADAELRDYQTTLLESEQRFLTLVEQSIAGAFIAQGGHYVYVNPRFEQILGYEGTAGTEDGLVGRASESIICPRDLPETLPKILDLREGRTQRTSMVFTAVRRDGSEVDVGLTAARATYHQQPAAIGLVQDITDRKVAEEQIRRYADKLKETLMRTVTMVTTLVEMRDPYTVGHEKRVAELAVAIGREMGLDAERLEGLRIGGYLHDVGKVMVPTEILAKPSRISDLEYSLIQQHAQAGYDILKEVDFPWPVARIAREHHERIDGSGYPQGLKGDEILLEARITAVADVVEAMASHRPYRPGLGLEKALAELRRGKGTAYDPVAVDACLTLFSARGYILPE